MLGEKTVKALNTFAEDIKRFAKLNLGVQNRKRRYPSGRTITGPINASGKLSSSIDYDIKISKNSVQLNVEMEKYGEVVDQGRKKAFIPIAPLVNWIKVKRVRMRDENGKFIKTNPVSLAHAISKSANKYPRKGTFFLTDAVAQATKKHEDELINNIFLDTEDAIGFILRNLNNGNSNN